MKTQILSIILSSLLVLVSADNSCTFTIDQLNNQILTPVQRTDCDSCLTSNVKMTISSNSKQITNIRLATVDGSGITPIDITPLTSSLIIDPSFQVWLISKSGQQMGTEFMISCKTQTTNGKLTYNLSFIASTGKNFQSFDLNIRYTGSLLLKNISIVALVLSIILLF